MNAISNRVLLLTDSLNIGGSERQIVELMKGLRASGRYSTVLGVLTRGGELWKEGAAFATDVVDLARAARFDCKPALALIGHARRTGVGLLHAQGWMSSAAALIAARWLRLPVVCAGLRAMPKSERRHRIMCWCARRSDAIVANGPALLHAYGLDTHPRACVIENGVDLARFDGVIPAEPGEVSVCMVANFRGAKDHATLIRAFPHIRKAVPSTKLVLVGRDAGTLEELRALVSTLGLGEAVRFVTNCTRPEPFIAGSAVSVLSTRGEGLPNAIIEAMALGKPVVASECAGTAQLVRNGETGYLVPRASPQALAARVIELLGDRERARRMGEEARRIVARRYSLQRMVSDYEDLYDRVQHRGRSRDR